MNICYVNPTKVLRRPIVEISHILADKGHKVSLLYPNDVKDPLKGFHFLKLLKHKNIKLIPVDSFYFARWRYALPNPFDLFSKLKKVFRDNDIIHIWEYYYPYSVFAILMKLFFRKKKVILTTDGFVGYSYKPQGISFLFRLYTQLFAKFLFKIPDEMTTYGKSMIPYSKQAGVKRIKVLSTGIDLNKFKCDNLGKIRKEFGITKSQFFILFIGMLTERKRVDYVIRISKKLISEGFNVKTLIVGHGPLEEEYKTMITKNFRDKIILVGSRTDVSDFLFDCDVLFLPALGEGLPGVVMEAMACGKPVVATNEGCTPDLVDRETGFLINEDDEEGYYLALKKLILNKKLGPGLGFKGRLKIKHFDWEIVVKKYLKLYEFLLKNV